MNRVIINLVIWAVMAIVLGISGRCAGPIKIHHSGNASYVTNSHCIVFTDVKQEQFENLLEWCGKLHQGE